MNMKSLVAISALCLLAGCAGETITVSARPITVDVARAVDPQAVRMQPVNFRVITRENLDAFIQEMSTHPNNNIVFIAITTRDYDNIRLNFADLRRYVEQQRSVIAYYREVVATPTETVTTRTPTPSN
jgi:hypothetical protein